jgi:hypothetical protein
MDQPLASPSDARATPPADIQSRLRGRWLLAARLGWIVLAITVVALNIIALPNTALAPLPPDLVRALNRVGFSPALYNAVGSIGNSLVLLSFLGVAILLIWRKSNDRMALFGAYMFLVFGGVVGSGLYDSDIGGVVPALAAIPVVHQIASLLAVIAQVSLVAFLYLFPSGRFVPRWMGWVTLLMVVYWTAVLFISPTMITGPLGAIFIAFLTLGLIAQVYRYLRVSTPKEREQTKWAVFGIVIAMLIIIVPQGIVEMFPQLALSDNSTPEIIVQLVINGRWFLAMTLIPISIAVAILSSRLWDIDVIINKALVYGSLTALLAAIYAGLVIGMETLVRDVSGKADLPPAFVVISTLVIAALFQPLRRLIQRFIDRRFYRGRYDSARTLAAFGTTLRTETDLGALSDDLIAAVQETMHPAHASLWLRAASSQREEGSVGKEG